MSVSSPPVRVLLHSAKGSGLHYGGPGSSAYRLYQNADQLMPNHFCLELIHGWPDQVRMPLFKAEHEIGDIRTPYKHYQFIRNCVRFVKRNAARFDIFHGVHGFQNTIVPALAAEQRGLPACIKLATHRADLAEKASVRHKVFRVAARRRAMAKQLSAMICISSTIVQECLEYGFDPERVAWIPDGCDTTRFAPGEDKQAERASLGLPERPTIVLSGGMIRRKRPDLLVGAAGLLRKQGLELQVLLVGPTDHEPAYVSEVKELAAEHGVTEQVSWAGFHADPTPYYRAADLFGLPSHAEGLPNAMIEAMSAGLPVIATDISGARDMVEPGVTGQLVEFTPESVAEAIKPFLVDEKLARQLGATCRERILANYSADVTVRRHAELFDAVRSGRSPRDVGMPYKA